MKNAANVMYKIARVFNIIAIVACALMVVLGVVFVTCSDMISGNGGGETEAAVLIAAGAVYIVIGLMELVVQIITVALVNKAISELNSDGDSKKMQIVMIVFGAIGSVFYLLGGIFGLVAKCTASGDGNGGDTEYHDAE